MSERGHKGAATRGSVLDPEWEDALIHGQEEAGEHGDLDADLAMLHLMRHSREPEALSGAQLDEIWSAVEAEVAPLPWWRRRLMWWATPVAVSAAVAIVAIVVIIPSDPGSQLDGAVALQSAESAPEAKDAVAVADEAESRSNARPEARRAKAAAPGKSSRTGTPKILEEQFAMLAPRGHASVDASIEGSRHQIRTALIGTAKRANR
jgi:hypothetical protein